MSNTYAINPQSTILDITRSNDDLDLRYLKLTGSLAEVSNHSHTVLTDIGTNTHAQIDTHISDTSDPHGAAMSISTSLTSPLIIGGTGTTSDLTLQTTSGVGAAGADMHFLVGNNGATEAMTILNSGFVGIGVVSPGVALDVTGVGRFSTQTTAPYSNMSGGATGKTAVSFNGAGTNYGTIQVPSAGVTVSTWSLGYQAAASNTIGTAVLSWNESGNVGIGTTAPSSKLDVLGRLLLVGADHGTTWAARTNTTAKSGYISIPHYTNSEEAISLINGYSSAASSEIVIGGGTSDYNVATLLAFYTAANVTTTGGTERMRIDSAGNIGIGVTDPTALVHLKAGTATASTAPLKFTSGTLNTTAEAGAMEFLTDALYFTITTSAVRKTIAFLESPSFTTPTLGVATCTTLSVAGNQVVGARVVDARADDVINSGDATTDGVIDALRDAMITHGLIAAA